jgi:hypothetical protein
MAESIEEVVRVKVKASCLKDGCFPVSVKMELSRGEKGQVMDTIASLLGASTGKYRHLNVIITLHPQYDMYHPCNMLNSVRPYYSRCDTVTLYIERNFTISMCINSPILQIVPVCKTLSMENSPLSYYPRYNTVTLYRDGNLP